MTSTTQTNLSAHHLSANRHRYLQVADLRRLRHLLFSSKRVVEGQYAGRHASPQRGHSVEFSDYRQYTPGDELGDVDWKVYARTDKYVIKLFEHQSDMTVHLLIDASASMAYRGVDDRRGDSKYDHACRLAASIAFLTIKQQDKVGLAVAKQGLDAVLPAQGAYTQLHKVLQHMEQTQPKGQADLAATLDGLARRSARRGVVILFSDLLEPAEDILQKLAAFTHRGSEVIVFHVLHADELHLPDSLAEATFEDSETGGRVRLNTDDIRAQYRQRMQRFLDTWRTAFRSRGVDYNLASTAKPYSAALEDYLFARSRVI
ncbi:MAG: DUF58 domain-containing protein [Planctomycetota bacterium]